MKKSFILTGILLATMFATSQKITTKFEQSNGKQTPTYFEVIEWWKKLDDLSGKVKMLTMGMTDAGFPLNLIVVSNNGDYNFSNIRRNNKRIILINNWIHPGEPDGIDASMLLVRDIITRKYVLPPNTVLAIIPVIISGDAWTVVPITGLTRMARKNSGSGVTRRILTWTATSLNPIQKTPGLLPQYFIYSIRMYLLITM